VDVWAGRPAGTRDEVLVLLTNHNLPRQSIARHEVRVELADSPVPRSVTVERIDADHANAPAAWRRLGSPEYLEAAEVEALGTASRLVPEDIGWQYEDGTTRLVTDLPPQAVAAVTVRF
jgi:xylan 1,4-beta-xylosidase